MQVPNFKPVMYYIEEFCRRRRLRQSDTMAQPACGLAHRECLTQERVLCGRVTETGRQALLACYGGRLGIGEWRYGRFEESPDARCQLCRAGGLGNEIGPTRLKPGRASK